MKRISLLDLMVCGLLALSPDVPAQAPPEPADAAMADDTSGQPAEPAALDAEDAPQSRAPDGHGALLLNADGPRDLVWDSARHAGALALRGYVVALGELRTPGGQAAGVPFLVGSVPLRAAEHLALAEGEAVVYASDRRGHLIQIIDLDKGSLRGTFPTGGPLPGVLFHHPALKRIASFNAGASTVTLFDAASLSFEGLIPLGDAPLAARMAPDGRVLVLLPERRELTLLGLRPLRIFSRWPLPAECTAPSDFAVDPVGQRVLLACGGAEIALFGLKEGDWVGSLMAPAGLDVRHVFWDGVRHRVLAVAEDGSVSAVAGDPAAATVLATVSPGSRVAFDAAGNRLLTATNDEQGRLRVEFVPLP